ncbi:hypothetical protein BpHYR1_000787 [Brachionus plicatilis]|uniref:Uncharacterized protein n=1 Tax=Brachionus plicatilis TaxID=10195 RepID=A0A3M7SVV6_BRAPC|nr:hypothetical protein BpHYR1_000787 [Brachionus plicatilis]
MSSKLSVCLYTVIIDFTIMILLILGCIMTIFYLQINVAKTFPDSCLINSSTTSTAFTTLSTLTTSATTNTEISITTIATSATTNTEISITTTAAVTTGSQSCVANLDCLGSSVSGISTAGVFQTTQCGTSGVCECSPPYSEIVIGPPYRCTFPNGVSGTCTDDIECSGRCQEDLSKKSIVKEVLDCFEEHKEDVNNMLLLTQIKMKDLIKKESNGISDFIEKNAKRVIKIILALRKEKKEEIKKKYTQN